MSEQTTSHGSKLEEFDRLHPVTMEQDEIEYLCQAIKSSSDRALMVEWGSGGSTLRWLREMRDEQRLISIEHNEQWFSRVKTIVDSEPRLSSRLAYYLCPPNGYVDHGYGYPAEENPVGLDRYFAPTPEIFDADIFLIDGVARGVCLTLTLLRAVKPDAIIFLHDWSKRKLWYSWATQFYRSCESVGATLCKLSR